MYIGNTPQNQAYAPAVDFISGNASTTTFTLSRPVASTYQMIVVVANVAQNPGSAYTVSGNTITFASAPPTGTNNIWVEYTSLITQVIQPGQGTVGTTQLVDGSITTAKLASSFIAPENNGGTGTTTGYYGFKNRIINGRMEISQRNGTTSVNVSGTSYSYQMDRFYMGGLNGVATPFTLQQVSDAPTGYVNSVKLTTNTTDALGTAATEYEFQQTIEANNVSDFNLGTANAVTVTLSFWVKSSLTGLFGLGIRNAPTFNRSYVATYTINAANTWEQKTVTLTMDTTGTWATSGDGATLNIAWSLGVGTNGRGTAGVWQAGGQVQTSSCVNVVSNAAATWQITGVQLEKGSTATSFDYRPYGTELALCQRYYWRNNDPTATSTFIPCGNGYTFNSTTGTFQLSFPVTMRTRVATINFSNVRVFGPANGSSGVVTSISGIQSTNTVFQADVAASSASFTAGTPAALQGNNNTAAYAEFSAEL